MATYTINTAQAIDTLVDTGIEPNQAKAIVQVFGETQEALATKNDVQSLVSRVDSLESKMDSKFDAFETTIMAEIKASLFQTNFAVASSSCQLY